MFLYSVLTRLLAQVEGLLKHVGKQRTSHSDRPDGGATGGSSPGALGEDSSLPDRLQGSPLEGTMQWFPMSPTDSPASGDNAQFGELLGLGQFESLPPFEMIEDLYASAVHPRASRDADIDIVTRSTSTYSLILCQSFTPATTCEPSTPHHICALLWPCSMPSGPPLRTATRSTGATTTRCISVPASISKLTS